MQSTLDALGSLVASVAGLLLMLTVFPLLMKLLVPVLGDTVWRGWCRLLAWLLVAPLRLVALLWREATRRR